MRTPSLSPRFLLLPAVLAVATASLFIRLADVSPVAAAFWRAAVTGIVYLPSFLLPIVREQWRHIPRGSLVALVAATLIIVLHNILFISSLSYTTVAASVVITSTQPIFTAVLGRLLLSEKVSVRAIVGLIGALVGTAVISLSQGGNTSLKGNLLALAAAVTVAAFAVCARKLRQVVPIVPFMFTVQLASSFYLFLIALVWAIPLAGFDISSWKALLLLGLIPTFIGHSLLSYALGYLKAYLVGLAIIGEPVGATILAAIFLGEIPSGQALVGVLLILASILFAMSERETIPPAIAD